MRDSALGIGDLRIVGRRDSAVGLGAQGREWLEIHSRRCYKKRGCWGPSPVPDACSSKGCKASVPAGLAAEHMCVLHFTLFIEQECAEMRRETALGTANHERQLDFIRKIAARGESLVHTATSGFSMSDELKARVLSTLLTLMNCRENIDRAAMRQSALRRFAG